MTCAVEAPIAHPSVFDIITDATTVVGKDENSIKKSHFVTSRRIISILLSYRYESEKEIPESSYILQHVGIISDVLNKRPIHMVLPAFPFKSPNRVDKALGKLPDGGEQLALARLEGLCMAIEDIYSPGARICIVSDGLVYNDLLGVSDEEVWAYGEALRALSKERFPHISFARIGQLIPSLLSFQHPDSEAAYVANINIYREALIQNLPSDFSLPHLLASDVDTMMTFRGYIKFLTKDLAHSEIVRHSSAKMFKKDVEQIAKKMIMRGKAYAIAIANAFPYSVRLTIHPSNSAHKISVALGNSEACTTPWHCSPAFELDGTAVFRHREHFDNSAKYELVHGTNNNPMFFRERSTLWDWGDLNVSFEPLYPCGLLIKPEQEGAYSIESVPMHQVRALAELNSPVILRGFRSTRDRPIFVQKAREMGPITPWKFGEVLVVKDGGGNAAGLNNVLSDEPMPMHFDGLFKVVKEVINGKEVTVPQPPRFQMFVAVTPSPKNTGYTLFASSRLALAHLPPHVPISLLSKSTWSVSTDSFDGTTIHGLSLITPHPTLETPCLRYHEHWPQERTKFDPTLVSVVDEDGSERQEVRDVLDKLLYDRRVCYWHSWEEGDMLISDNIGMMHTRSMFTAAEGRELWRVHVN